MKISIKKDDGFVSYESALEDATLLELLNDIKQTKDNTLAFSSGCRSSVCGSCSMRVNEVEVLACSYKIQEGDIVEPLKNVPVIRDLVVDMDKAYSFNIKAKAWLSKISSEIQLDSQDAKTNEVQSDCILCGSCYSACPVYAVNGEFIGPFSLTRVWKYASDKREVDVEQKMNDVQTNGIWDCTLCGNCTVVCPQNISSKADIEMLRMKSAQYGLMDPNFGSFDGGFGFDGSPSF
ncbi:succinate dehydrogenase/fumarate reductase iron-sulfur subunit [Sulfurimonas sp. SAG-AH-194-C20]|nr:2Fe-2S iron-sulfur cluster-binding protein [Sulfurimonas sp. SAG-AH-194-C20]MDF1878646.1 succinate dehydrogenase/fumarate reductase iron-sulfur subunit [Sulfurimonas sp. SAG-AH-194-C20]